jgi:methionyl-tRNA formyltransferase
LKRVALSNELRVLQPQSLKSPAAVEELSQLKPDVIIVAAYGKLLPQQVLDIPPLGCLNIHPSLLPKYRGPSPMATAILSGDDESGVTIMLMDAGLDTGPILAQRAITINAQDTTESLSAKLAQAGAELLGQTLPLWLEHSLKPQPQDEKKATYTKPISKGDGEIDWHLSAIELWRGVCAFHPWPGCYTRWRGKLLKLIEVVPLLSAEGVEPGQVISLPPGQGVVVGVGTGDGILGLVRVQPEGKGIMTAAEFLRGRREFIGETLPSKPLP